MNACVFIQLNLVLGLVEIIDLLEWQHLWGIVVAELAQDNTIPECLLQFSRRGKFLVNA